MIRSKVSSELGNLANCGISNCCFNVSLDLSDVYEAQGSDKCSDEVEGEARQIILAETVLSEYLKVLSKSFNRPYIHSGNIFVPT